MARYILRGRRPIRDFRTVGDTPEPVVRRGHVVHRDPVPAQSAPSPLGYWSMKKADLAALAEARGLDASGTRAEIIGRL